MKDIQKQKDTRCINIKKVGVKTINYPITLLDKAHSRQHTIATVNMYVNLPHHFKGTHMSRFVEILNRFHGAIDIGKFKSILEEMKKKLEAEAAHLEMSFIYFLERENENPECLKSCRYDCTIHGSLKKEDDLELQVVVPVSTPFPKDESKGLPRSLGRWGKAVAAVRFRNFIWIEDIITLVEQAVEEVHKGASEGGEHQVMSVESLTRRIGENLESETAIRSFSLTVENFADGYSTFATIGTI